MNAMKAGFSVCRFLPICIEHDTTFIYKIRSIQGTQGMSILQVVFLKSQPTAQSFYKVCILFHFRLKNFTSPHEIPEKTTQGCPIIWTFEKSSGFATDQPTDSLFVTGDRQAALLAIVWVVKAQYVPQQVALASGSQGDSQAGSRSRFW